MESNAYAIMNRVLSENRIIAVMLHPDARVNDDALTAQLSTAYPRLPVRVSRDAIPEEEARWESANLNERTLILGPGDQYLGTVEVLLPIPRSESWATEIQTRDEVAALVANLHATA